MYLAFGDERHKAENGLHILDTRDLYAPVLIGKVHFRDWVEGIYVADDDAYVANTWSGVRSLDIRYLDHPAVVVTFDVTDWVFPINVSQERRITGKLRRPVWIRPT